MSVKVTTNFAHLNGISNRAKKALVIMGEQLRQDVINSMSKGISPIQNEGRFAGYKNPAKYPANLKPARPVNLYLTGDLYSGIDYEIKGNKLIFGVLDSTQKQKAIGLTQGFSKTKDGRIIEFAAPRPFIPDESKGQRFNSKIVNNFFRILREEILKRG